MSKNILILAAHPDDETLGCGATIARLAEEGNRVHLITFTDGVSARDGTELKNRNSKLEKVSEILGIQSYDAADFPDNQMDAVPLLDICKFMEKNIPFDPQIVFTHHPGFSALNALLHVTSYLIMFLHPPITIHWLISMVMCFTM